MRYMLDTNTCIYLIKRHPPEVKQRLGTLSVGEVAVSSVVTAELWYGIAQSSKKKHNEAALEDFLKYVIVLDWPLKAAPELRQDPSPPEEKRNPDWCDGPAHCRSCHGARCGASH
jgi:predicted nucleic acid-binding protein